MIAVRLDARIPVSLHPGGAGGAPSPDAVLVAVGGAAGATGDPNWAAVRQVPDTVLAGAHPGSCACCGGRNGFSRLLGELFRDRATGRLPFFAVLRVVLPPRLERAAAEALSSDPLLSARFRLATRPGEN